MGTRSRYFKYETEILNLYSEGKSFSEIAEELARLGMEKPRANAIKKWGELHHPDIIVPENKPNSGKHSLCTNRCKSCYYSTVLSGTTIACMYIVMEGTLKDCDAGDKCTKYRKGSYERGKHRKA